MENADFTPLEQGIFTITFESQAGRKKVMDQGPWSFMNNLLILKQWEPNTTVLCYKFDSCNFWVHVLGLPFEWISVEVVREVVGNIGQVQEAKIETRGMVSYGTA